MMAPRFKFFSTQELGHGLFRSSVLGCHGMVGSVVRPTHFNPIGSTVGN